MNTQGTQNFGQIVTEKSNDELLAILAEPGDWQLDILGAAKTQLQRRGFEFIASTPQETVSDPEFEALQALAIRRILRKHLLKQGIGSIFWGLLAIRARRGGNG